MKTHPQPKQPQRNLERREQRHVSSVYEMNFAGMTDIGLRRADNEDAYLMAPLDDLFVIADGMGGHAAGEVASRLTCDLIGAYFQETADMDGDEMPMPYALPDDMCNAERRLVTAIKLANTAVYEQGLANAEQQGMGSTVVAVHMEEDKLFWAHVGDSRLYRLRFGRMMQLTSDHSLLNHAIEERGLKGEELQAYVKHFPYKNILVRAVGVRRDVKVESGWSSMEDGDVFLLCTDGVHNLLNEADLSVVLKGFPGDLQAACRKIVQEVNQRGGHDNITVVALEACRIT